MSQMSGGDLLASEVQARIKGASSSAACGNMRQASWVYMETRLCPDTPRNAISFNCSTSRFPLQADARMICDRFFLRTGTCSEGRVRGQISDGLWWSLGQGVARTDGTNEPTEFPGL
jgi:hypothetical protein